MKRIIEHQQNLIFPMMEMKYSSTIGLQTESSAAIMRLLCDGCYRPICDRYIMKIVDTSYHERCLQCTSCSIHLIQTCFVRDGKLYCRIDYERLFVKNRCLGCSEKIDPDEFVMRTLDNVFHLKCFICVVCGVRLQKGQQYVVKQSQLFCRMDYEKEVEMLQVTNDEFYCEDLLQTRIDGRRGPKRPRTILTTRQRRAFKASFQQTPKPCRKGREKLANDTGLSIRMVQVWFQNQRAKVKKQQNKVQQADKLKDGENNTFDIDTKKEKDENQSDSDSFTSHDSISYRPIKDELDNDDDFYDTTNFTTRTLIQHNCEDINRKLESSQLNTLLNLGYTSLQQMVVASQILNPIDRLYSMQNQYFKTDDMINQNLNEHL